MKNRTELINALTQTIVAHNNNRIICAKLEQIFLARNVSIGEITPFWIGIKDLVDAPDIILFLLTYVLYEITGAENIKPGNYFSQTEIKDSLAWKKELSFDKISLPIEISNVVFVSDSQWLTVVDIQTLKQWYYDLPIVYNFNTQRYVKLKRSKDGSIITVKGSNPKAISEISERLLRNRQFKFFEPHK